MEIKKFHLYASQALFSLTIQSTVISVSSKGRLLLSCQDPQSRIDVVDSLMAIAVKKYSDVYYIKTNATEPNHETSIDGTHPSDYGYGVWEKSIEKKVMKILRK